MDIEDIDVFIGIDVGKSEHWATALNRDGQKSGVRGVFRTGGVFLPVSR